MLSSLHSNSTVVLLPAPEAPDRARICGLKPSIVGSKTVSSSLEESYLTFKFIWAAKSAFGILPLRLYRTVPALPNDSLWAAVAFRIQSLIDFTWKMQRNIRSNQSARQRCNNSKSDCMEIPVMSAEPDPWLQSACASKATVWTAHNWQESFDLSAEPHQRCHQFSSFGRSAWTSSHLQVEVEVCVSELVINAIDTAVRVIQWLYAVYRIETLLVVLSNAHFTIQNKLSISVFVYSSTSSILCRHSSNSTNEEKIE